MLCFLTPRLESSSESNFAGAKPHCHHLRILVPVRALGRGVVLKARNKRRETLLVVHNDRAILESKNLRGTTSHDLGSKSPFAATILADGAIASQVTDNI